MHPQREGEQWQHITTNYEEYRHSLVAAHNHRPAHLIRRLRSDPPSPSHLPNRPIGRTRSILISYCISNKIWETSDRHRRIEVAHKSLISHTRLHTTPVSIQNLPVDFNEQQTCVPVYRKRAINVSSRRRKKHAPLPTTATHAYLDTVHPNFPHQPPPKPRSSAVTHRNEQQTCIPVDRNEQ